jgi:hypothetical protein
MQKGSLKNVQQKGSLKNVQPKGFLKTEKALKNCKNTFSESYSKLFLKINQKDACHRHFQSCQAQT